MDPSQYTHKVFALSMSDFDSLALEIFRFQYSKNPVYRDYVNALHINDASVKNITQIPFLPISFFKSHPVKTTSFEPELTFESSGTTSSVNSKHLIKDAAVYRKSFITGFELAYGSIKDWCIIGLLPSYLERGNSSLVYMVDELVRQSAHPQSGFYLDQYQKLFMVLQQLEEAGQKTLLIGVTFALLDFAEKYSLPLKHTMIMETGGMKGRRKEMIREEVHAILKGSFGLKEIHSEYGMTELLSQAYSKGNGRFSCPPWMRVLIRDDEDPLLVQSGVGRPELEVGNTSPETGSGLQTPVSRLNLSGAINIIDLANIYSCSFIATDDAGRLYDDGSFEVLGRMDNSDLRGCSLMAV